MGETSSMCRRDAGSAGLTELHYLRWNLFEIKGDPYFQLWASSTRISTNTPKTAVAIFAGRAGHGLRES